MLLPIKMHFPARVLAQTSRTIELEPLLHVKPILLPRLHFLNTSTTNSFTVVVKQTFRIGPSDDPMYSANYTNTLSTLNLGSGQRATVALDTAGVDGVFDFHSITFTNNATTATEILHIWMSGLFDESLPKQPVYPPREV